jgi:hypothetical protein
MSPREQAAMTGAAAGCLCVLAFLFGAVTERVRARCDAGPVIHRHAEATAPQERITSLDRDWENHP